MPFIENIMDSRRFAAEKMQKVNLLETPHLFCDVYCLEPGQEQKPHTHENATKFYHVLEGRGEFLVGPDKRELGPGGLAVARPGIVHGVQNRSDERLTLMVVMAPNPNQPPEPVSPLGGLVKM